MPNTLIVKLPTRQIVVNETTADALINKFKKAYLIEAERSGARPSLCVIGFIEYENLRAALFFKFGDTLRYPSSSKTNEFMGVELYKNHTFEFGMWFGGQPLE